MKCFVNAIALMFLMAPALAFAHDGHDHIHLYEEIHADELKNKMDAGESIIIIDARTKDRDDKNRIPGAKSLPFNAADKEIASLLPSKEALIVVYCTNTKCRESTFLAERLATLGYTHIYKYHEGINDWIKRGHKVEHAK